MKIIATIFAVLLLIGCKFGSNDLISKTPSTQSCAFNGSYAPVTFRITSDRFTKDGFNWNAHRVLGVFAVLDTDPHSIQLFTKFGVIQADCVYIGANSFDSGLFSIDFRPEWHESTFPGLIRRLQVCLTAWGIPPDKRSNDYLEMWAKTSPPAAGDNSTAPYIICYQLDNDCSIRIELWSYHLVGWYAIINYSQKGLHEQ